MNQLEQVLHRHIENEGPISVAHFMQLALQHPQYGYYVTGDPLGLAGDFTTAPEISQMFGEMLGVWCADMWRRLGEPDPFILLEIGPGRGTLMADILRATQHVQGFHGALRLFLVESNETFREQQAEKLKSYHPVYVQDVAALPALPMLVLANEFFDALPIHQYYRVGADWFEKKVGLVEGKLAFVAGEKESFLPLPEEGNFYEVSPQGLSLMKDLAAHVAVHGGAGLVVDYGYNKPIQGSTLQAVSGHKSVDPLERVGEVDLTAHVDFTALSIAASKQMCFVPHLLEQGAFLSGLAIDLRAAQLKLRADSHQASMIDSALKRLVDPDEMGALFKVMAFAPEKIKEISGFV